MTDFDGQAMELAEARILVDRLNVRMGVTDAQHQAMVAGSAFGFHVPAAEHFEPEMNQCAYWQREAAGNERAPRLDAETRIEPCPQAS
ncbi:hypothetical protein QTI33_08035 [Variovorax sp. J22P271]|uniref:hypothetical protein n=1 Tax=Variovorax davisae TaxID=3053515 RepID=UPI002574AB0B|nr:hypothetical protein [Variovorax sp. J22P271]MDM0032087.1 hypothetical protein [Variovorax sp. J22P271]